MNNDNFLKLFENFLNIYKLVNRDKIIGLLRNELDSKLLINVYSITDGEKSTRQISELINKEFSHSKIAVLWRRWALIGIVNTNQNGRAKAIFDLSEYGITEIKEENNG